MDLLNLLPLLNGNADLQTLLTRMLSERQSPPSAQSKPKEVPVTDPCRADYARLYPDYQRIADLPRRDEPPKPPSSAPDLSQLLSLFAAINAGKNRASPSAPPDDLAPTAPPEIRASLHAILSRTSLTRE